MRRKAKKHEPVDVLIELRAVKMRRKGEEKGWPKAIVRR